MLWEFIRHIQQVCILAMILCINTCKLFGGDLYLFCVLLLLKKGDDPIWSHVTTILFNRVETGTYFTDLHRWIKKHMLIWSMTRPQNGRKSVGARDTTIRSLAILAVDNPRIWYVFGWLNYHQTFLAVKKAVSAAQIGPSKSSGEQPVAKCVLSTIQASALSFDYWKHQKVERWRTYDYL